MFWLDPKFWVTVSIVCLVAFLSGVGIGYTKGANKYRTKLAAYKSEVEAAALAQEVENARVLRKAEVVAEQTGKELTKANELIDAQTEQIRRLLLDPRLRVSLPGVARSVFNHSTRQAPAAPPAAPRADGKAGPAEAAPGGGRGVQIPPVPGDERPVDLTVLLETAAENHRNHLHCVAQVESWQRFYTQVQAAYNGDGK